VHLCAGAARAAVAARGAEWREWKVGNTDLLWPGDAAIWDAVAPILFPVVGWTRGRRVRIGREVYPLGLHGFAATMDFALLERAEDRVRLVLRDGPQTRALYPFAFRFEVEYRLSAAAMDITLSVENSGTAAMPYAVGLHPGFRWPLADSTAPHRIIFEKPERAKVPVIAPGGLFSARTRPVPLRERVLPLTPDLLAQEALCFLGVASRQLLFDNGAGQGLGVTLQGFPHVALWSRPPASFLAIEAWTGYGDPENFEGDLFEKPSMIILDPGERRVHSARYVFVSDTQEVGTDLQIGTHLSKAR
jgi:galactose mutarotase-like enzyme